MNKLEIIQKLKALSDRGINGEKENATKLLHKLMKKYGISEEELEDEVTKKEVQITINNEIELKMCHQILYAYFNNASLYKRIRAKTKYFTEFTAAEEIEFKYIFSIYKDSFYKEQDILYEAFVYKNNIFPPKSENSSNDEHEEKEETAEDRARNFKVASMMQFMEKTQIRKALGS